MLAGENLPKKTVIKRNYASFIVEVLLRKKKCFLGPTYFTYFVIKTVRYRIAEA